MIGEVRAGVARCRHRRMSGAARPLPRRRAGLRARQQPAGDRRAGRRRRAAGRASRAVISDRADAGGARLGRAHAASPTVGAVAARLRRTAPRTTARWPTPSQRFAPGLVVLAGFMRILGDEFVRPLRRPPAQHPPVAAAALPRPAHAPPGARGRRPRARRQRAFRDAPNSTAARWSYRPGSRCCRTTTTRPASPRACCARNTVIYPRVHRLVRAGRLQCATAAPWLDGQPLDCPGACGDGRHGCAMRDSARRVASAASLPAPLRAPCSRRRPSGRRPGAGPAAVQGALPGQLPRPERRRRSKLSCTRGTVAGQWLYETRAFPSLLGRVAVSPQARERSVMQVRAGRRAAAERSTSTTAATSSAQGRALRRSTGTPAG